MWRRSIFGLTDPGERKLLEWVQEMSWYIFNPYPSADDRARGIQAGGKLRDHVRRLVERRRPTRTPSTVLDWLLGVRSTASSARTVETILIGLVAGTLGPPPRLFVNMVDRLLSLGPLRRRRLERAAVERNGSRSGSTCSRPGASVPTRA